MHASAQVVETHDAGATGAAHGPPNPVTGEPAGSSGRRISHRAIEWTGLVLGIAFVAAVALDHQLSNDEFWSLAAGQWMLSHHAFVGLDPFSYTEAHRRWVTDEWGSELVLAGLFRVFGAAAWDLYATVLGGLSLLATTAYLRALGAKGGRVVAIVLLLAFGLAGTLASDRGLDFSLVWLPLELLLLTKARQDPRWLLVLPPLFLAWVNTHGSVLLGLIVIAVEFGWSLAPTRVVARWYGMHQSPWTAWLGLTVMANLAACCVTPYGPQLLVYDLDVSRNAQIGQHISEWSSPDFHSVMALLAYCIPLVVFVACVRARRVPVLEGSLTVVLFVEALRTQRLVVYLMVVVAGLAAMLPNRAPWSARTRRWVGGGLIVLAAFIVAAPSVPPGSLAPTLPVQAFDYLSSQRGRIFTEYTWGDYSIARHRATFVDGRTDLFEGAVLNEYFDVADMNVDPDRVLATYHVSYVVWAPHSALSVFLTHDPRWQVVDRSSVALVFARRTPR